MKSIHIFAIAALGEGLSGSDRIFIEFARRWSENVKVNIYVWEDGYKMCKRQGLVPSNNLNFHVLNIGSFCKFGFLICYLARIIRSIILALKLIVDNKSAVIYSASEFWMDSLPAYILKIRNPKSLWFASWYQSAPSPLVGFSQGERSDSFKLNALIYWLIQLPIKSLITHFADFVLVNNDEEKLKFPKLNRKKHAVVVLGAVDLEKIESYKKLNPKPYTLYPKYDAVFQGRFHPQKGVVELIDIWKKVNRKIPGAKLVMIGDGPLRKDVEERIKRLELNRDIKLFGWVFDGPQKYKIFSQSKMVVHPAFYDSGGMATAEAMAFGLPAVGFDLPAFKYYYPKGMVKVRIGNLTDFANAVIKLIKDSNYRNALGKKGLMMIKTDWSWDKRANEILQRMKTNE